MEIKDGLNYEYEELCRWIVTQAQNYLMALGSMRRRGPKIGT